MAKPTLESLEDRLAPAVLHAVGADFSLRGSTLYESTQSVAGAGPWSASLYGVRSVIVAAQGQVVDALLINEQVVSSVQAPAGSTPWQLSLIDVHALTFQNGVATATLEKGLPRYNDYHLGPGTPWQKSLSAPLQTWEVDWASYTKTQKQYIESKVAIALSALPPGASDFYKAAALTSFVYQWVHRNGNLNTHNGYEVLTQRGAVCGGMAVTLAEMLMVAGIPSRHYFELGGLNPAHSMLEAHFRDGTSGILDPYYGVVYYDMKLGRPVGVADLNHYLASGALCSYMCKRGDFLENPAKDPPIQPMRTFLGTYTPTIGNALTFYSYPGVFTNSLQHHLAYDGLPVTVSVPLKPGSVLGQTSWQPSARAPRPWSSLGAATLDDGEFLSWAYVLGFSGGSQVEHNYLLSGLSAGKHYRLSLTVANAGTLPGLPSTPSLALQGAGQLEITALRRGFWQKGEPYQPQVVTLTFTATGKTATIHASAMGALVLAGIGLKGL
jgi:hypothetical protein